MKLSALQDRDSPSIATVMCIVPAAAPAQGGDAEAAEASVDSNREEIGGMQTLPGNDWGNFLGPDGQDHDW